LHLIGVYIIFIDAGQTNIKLSVIIMQSRN